MKHTNQGDERAVVTILILGICICLFNYVKQETKIVMADSWTCENKYSGVPLSPHRCKVDLL